MVLLSLGALRRRGRRSTFPKRVPNTMELTVLLVPRTSMNEMLLRRPLRTYVHLRCFWHEQGQVYWYLYSQYFTNRDFRLFVNEVRGARPRVFLETSTSGAGMHLSSVA